MWKNALIIVLLIVVIALVASRYDHRRRLTGIWAATPNFCKESGISSFVIKFDSPRAGSIVMTALDGVGVLCNTKFSVCGWGFIAPFSPDFSTRVTFDFEGKCPLPPKCAIEHKDAGLLLIKANGKLQGEFTKMA